MRLISRTIVLAGAVVLFSGSVFGHHGFTGSYDRSAPVYLEGTVERAYFGQPHAEITLVNDAETLPAEATDLSPGLQVMARGDVTVEFPPLRTFFQLDGRVSPGDRVSIVALRNCEPPHQLRGQWIRLQDGHVAASDRRAQTEVEGC